MSHEFRSYRDVLAANLAQPGVEIRRQEDFVNAGQTTLEKLAVYIENCDSVIHLIGDATGDYPSAAEVESFTHVVTSLGLEDLNQPPGISYTQWEAWLGLYFRKPVAIYLAADVAQREAGFVPTSFQRQRQARHWNLLAARGRDRREFVSPQDLSIEVLRSLQLLVPGFAENVRLGEFRDRNLLFAVLALQDNMLSKESFVRVCRQWAEDTSQPIAEMLQHGGLMSPEDCSFVESRMERRLKRAGDVRQSLAESLGSDARQSLSEALDSAAFASLPDRFAAISSLHNSPEHSRYKLTRTHGSGGLGVISIADDIALGRTVAVKQLRQERLLDPMAVERFLREARITGRLQHPNIVPVYELGLTAEDQIPFYAMRFVGHHTLLDAIASHYASKETGVSDRNLRFRGLIQSLVAVCNAVAFAHQQRVIHRDIKPANVMIGEFGEVILLDWGLARRIDETDSSGPAESESADQHAGETRAGVILGTPAYMSPEQASGRIDLHNPQTDVYGLGVTLYEILTGFVPFAGTSTDELLTAVQEQKPFVNPRERNPDVPPALAAICSKAMRKRQADRYESVRLMADDILHWLADEPVSVFPEPTAQRIQRFARKHPGNVSAVAATILVGIAGLTAGLYFVNAEKNQTQIALRDKEAALIQKDDALTQRREALRQAENEAQRADAERDKAVEMVREASRSDFATGQTRISEYRFDEAIAYFERSLRYDGENPNARDALWLTLRYGQSQLAPLPSGPPLPHGNAANSAIFSSDGTRIITASNDHTARIWDVATGAPLGPALQHQGSVNFACFNPAGTLVATASDDQTARIWDAATSRQIGPAMQHQGAVKTVVFSHDGKSLATASTDHTARLWDVRSGQQLGPQLQHAAAVNSAVFSDDSSLIVTASDDQTARVWDVLTGLQSRSSLKHSDAVQAANFSPDHQTVVTASGSYVNGAEVALWKVSGGESDEPLLTTPGAFEFNGGRSAVFSPDGTRFVTACDDFSARIWDATTGRQIGSPLRHRHFVSSVDFSPDGTRIITGSYDETARLWDAMTGEPLGPSFQHRHDVLSVRFSPDGMRFSCASGTISFLSTDAGGTDQPEGEVRIWDAARSQPPGLVLVHDDEINSVAFSPDSRLLVTTSDDNTARLWEASNGHEITSPLQHLAAVTSAIFSPDGTAIITASADGTARIWSVSTGKPVGPPLQHQNAVNMAVFSRDGKRVVTASDDHTAHVWNALTCQPVGKPLVHQAIVNSASFSLDGTRIVTASNDHTARVWDAESGQAQGPVLQHEDSVRSAFFSRDGTRVYTSSEESGASRECIWDLSTGRPVESQGESQILPVQEWDLSDEFSHDGTRAIGRSDNYTAVILDVASRKPVGLPLRHSDFISSCSISPDGRRVVTTSQKLAQVWDAATGLAIGPPLEHQHPVKSATFNPNSTRLVTFCIDNVVRVWELHAPEWPNPAIVRDASQGIGGLLLDSEMGTLMNASATQRRVAVDAALEKLQNNPDWQFVLSSFTDHRPDLKVAPRSKISRRAMASALIRTGDPAFFDEVLRFDPGHPLLPIALAGNCPNTTSSEFLKDFGILRLPQNTVIWRDTAELLASQGDILRAKKAVEATAGLGIDRSELSQLARKLGNAAARNQDWPEARNALLRSVELNPEISGTRYELGLSSLAGGNTDEFVASVRDFLQWSSTRPDTPVLEVVALATFCDSDALDWPALLSQAERTVSNASKSAGDLETLGASRYRSGDMKGAISDLQSAVLLHSQRNGPEHLLHSDTGDQPVIGTLFSHAFLALAYHRFGEKDEAARHRALADMLYRVHYTDWQEQTRRRLLNAELIRVLGPSGQQ